MRNLVSFFLFYHLKSLPKVMICRDSVIPGQFCDVPTDALSALSYLPVVAPLVKLVSLCQYKFGQWTEEFRDNVSYFADSVISKHNQMSVSIPQPEHFHPL